MSQISLGKQENKRGVLKTNSLKICKFLRFRKEEQGVVELISPATLPT